MMQPFKPRLLLGGLVLLTAMMGCGRDSASTSPAVSPPPLRPLRAMESAIRRGQWQQAAEFADQVLETHPDDPDAIASVARVVFEAGDKGRAAELLVRACRVESFANASRVQQAMIAMIGEGRLHEGMAFLEQAITAQPEQQQTRRWLYDFYMGAENRLAGLPHGRMLVRQRAFDIDLLTTLSNTERRTQDAKPLTEMTARNPNDKRPLLGDAKTNFDAGKFDLCIDQLREIVTAHQDYLPAQALLGRALASDGRYQELESWAKSQSKAIQAYPEYWVALGDWLRADGRQAQSARAYWEATQRDVDWMEPWSKLVSAIESTQDSSIGLTEVEIDGVKNRADRLSRFNLLKSRFERTGKISRATVLEMVETLRDLGRLWEAEAWASIALTLPEDDAVDVAGVRQSIVAQLSKETPWQLTESFPELQINLRGIAVNEFADADRQEPNQSAAEASLPDATIVPDVPAVPSEKVTHLSLMNEAGQRGLHFFGRTGDRLSEPGIMLYQTLGCGGGTIDFDRDGWSDLYLVAAGGTPPAKDSADNALMRNVEGQFVDVTLNSETSDRGFGQGVAVGDVNEDGFPDLLVLNYGPNVLLINNGDGTFRDQTVRLPNNGNVWSTSGAIVDLDQDALSDVVIVNYCAGLEPITVGCPNEKTGRSQSCSPMKFNAEPDQFFLATANALDTDQTASGQAAPSVLGRGLGVVAGSFDRSTGIELLIANDMTNNHYWSGGVGESGFRLRESAMLRGLGANDRALAQGSMGIATGDFDQDGDIDFYVTNFHNEYNTYHTQQSDGIWQDETARLNLVAATFDMVGFGTAAVDLDRDTIPELLVTNGHVDVFNLPDRNAQGSYAQPLQLFRRNASNAYDSVGESLSGEYASTLHVGRALWTIDANRDAQVDVAVTHQTEPVALLVNHSEPKGRWLELSLTATQDSRDAIGAVVEVSLENETWMAALVSGDGYLCSDERILRFGLGEVSPTSLAKIRVTWPGGTSQLFDELPTNAAWLLVQGESSAFPLRP